jgi:hypothetical protein
MTYLDAIKATWAMPAEKLGPAEFTLWSAFLHTWNDSRRPPTLAAGDWSAAMDLAARHVKRSALYRAKDALVKAGWLAVTNRGRLLHQVAFGPAFLSQMGTGAFPNGDNLSQYGTGESQYGTGESQYGTTSPNMGLPYYRGEREKEEKKERETRERGLGGVLGRLVEVLETTYCRPLSASEVQVLASCPDSTLEPLVAFYAAPSADDDRRFRRRSIESLLENLVSERDRAAAWLATEAGRDYRRRMAPEEKQSWATRLIGLPEDILPAAWRSLWLAFMKAPVPDWPDVGAKSRQTFLAIVASEGGIPRIAFDQNQPLARRISQQWLAEQEKGARE